MISVKSFGKRKYNFTIFQKSAILCSKIQRFSAQNSAVFEGSKCHIYPHFLIGIFRRILLKTLEGFRHTFWSFSVKSFGKRKYNFTIFQKSAILRSKTQRFSAQNSVVFEGSNVTYMIYPLF